jgi:hypothetical protein
MNSHLFEMIRSVWLERIWTIQEFALAANATVHYGPVSCSWEAFSEAIRDDYNQLVFTFEIEDPKDERFRLLCALRESTRSLRPKSKKSKTSKTKQTQPETIDQVLDFVVSVLRFTEATDQKDKAFGIYGLLRLLEIELPAPDYTKSTRQIYMETMLAIHKANKTLNFRHFWHPESTSLNLPSWLPDWTGSKKWEFPRSLEPRGLHSPNRSHEFCASLKSAAISRTVEEEGQLFVKAIIIDCVCAVGLTYSVENAVWPDEQAVAVLQNWRSVAEEKLVVQDTESSSGEYDAMEALGEVMFRDTPIPRTLNVNKHYRFNKNALLEWFDNGAKGTIKDFFALPINLHMNVNLDKDRLSTSILPTWNGQKLYKTQASRLGMASSETRQGDVVALIAGCDLPLILRPCGDSFNYVAPTYFPGAMFGEMWPSTEDDKPQEIALV